MTRAGRALLGGLTPTQFLRRHWQRKPLLVRNAIPGFQDPLTPSQLARLASEDHVESRLVLERGGTRPWQVVEGPQPPGRLRRLPRSRWTLLVQGVDRWVPAVAELRERFRFIPDWRADDVMVSFAPRLGSVGPHLDSYDVFLLQGCGRRRWRIDPRADAACRPGLDLNVLRRFRPRREWILEPGDLLYLPPGVAHHGVALEDCLTYSIGFRAPSGTDLVAAALRTLLRDDEPKRLYRDPGLAAARHPGEISRSAIRRLRRLLESELTRLRGCAFDALLGELLTESGQPSARHARRLEPASSAALSDGASFVRAPASRLAYLRRRGTTELFVDGQRIALGRRLAFAAPLLTGARRLTAEALARHARTPGFPELLARLVSLGALELARRR